METRANYILIGAFTLLAILGTLGFFIWLASVQINRQYATYGILLEDVSGLDPSGDVLFNGISVGKVIGLRIYEEDPSKVFTTVEIDATTPIRTNTVAQLQSQGVTGVAYISLSGGTNGAAPLQSEDGSLPIIPSRRSTVQSLVEDAPNLVVEMMRLLKQLQAITGPENQARVENILRNFDISSGKLERSLDDFSDITGTVRDATLEISQFTQRLDTIGAAVEETLGHANTALASTQQAFETADTVLNSSAPVIASVERTFNQAENILQMQVPEILEKVSSAVALANEAIADIQGRSGEMLGGFTDTAGLLNARLTELEMTLFEANTAFAAVTEASDSFDVLVDGTGTMLVAEARDVLVDAKAAIATIEAVVLNDVPAVVEDIRAAVATASAAVERVAADLTGFTGRFDPLANSAQEAMISANALFGRARTSLDALDTTLSGANGALASAEAAFDATTGVMQTDLGPVLSDIRTASERISIAVENVTRDVPAIATELRALIGRTDAVVGQVQNAIAASAPGIGNFTQKGLPELTRLGVEARSLISTLNGLVRKIERDPARFLLDNRVPDYRRK